MKITTEIERLYLQIKTKLMISQERQKIRHLLVIKDRQGKRVIPLTMDFYTLGRSTDNSIVLYGSSVSRLHATITRITTPNNKLTPFKIVDGNLKGVKSTNGLFVNGTQYDNYNLKHGDFIEFGNTVKANYYTLFNLLDREFAEFCEIENNSEVVKSSIVASQLVTCHTHNLSEIDRQTLIRLASFPELTPHPIIEIDLIGSITYCNPMALHQFPNLKKLDKDHPLLTQIPTLFENNTNSHLIREIQFQSQFFEQSIQYIDEEKRIRILMRKITPQAEVIKVQAHSDRLLREVTAVSNTSFENKIQSLLAIGCDLFDLEIGFLGKIKDNSLQIVAIHQHKTGIRFLQKDQIWEIGTDSEDRSLRLFQFTADSCEPLTLKKFDRIDTHTILPSNKTLVTHRIPISDYLGIRLVNNHKTYGILSFLSPISRLDNFSPEKINFLQLMAQLLEKEIEKRQLELVLKNLLRQKNYSEQIVTEISQPITELIAITQQLVESNSDGAPDSLLEAIDTKSKNLMSLIQKILATSS